MYLSKDKNVLHCKEHGVVVALSDSVDKPEICSVNVVLEAIATTGATAQ